LSIGQKEHIQRLICERRPEQLKMVFALWSRPAVKYLACWGFTPQKPIRRAYEQSPQAVKVWLDDEYPAIAKRAKAENTKMHWGDETGLEDRRGACVQ